MSNLYKPWFVRTETTNTRVIDSDAVMAESLQKILNEIPPQVSAGPDGFEEGIFAESAENVLKEELDEKDRLFLREEADRILNEAKKQAQDLIGQAEAEAAEIRETAANEGYREGQGRLQQELSGLQAELEEAYREKMTVLDNEYQEKRNDMEKELVDVILEVFNKVFHIQFDHKKHILMYLINDAILNIEGEKKFRIRVAESNVLFLENHKEDILERVGHDIELEILPDYAMDGNGCMIETEAGVFDCGMGTQLDNLIKDIRSLCS